MQKAAFAPQIPPDDKRGGDLPEKFPEQISA